jgi:predicted O-methyltransferase YrrM
VTQTPVASPPGIAAHTASGTSRALDLDQGWAIGEESFRQIVERLRAAGARQIVEFGSGISSIRLALELPGARVFSIESNREWYETVLRMRAEHAVERNLTVVRRLLRWQKHAGAMFLSYAPGPLPQPIDAVLIDGPPTWTRRGREACLYQAMPFLRVGGLVFLDDFARSREKTIVRNWRWSYPGTFNLSTIESGHRVCVLEKVRDGKRPRRAMRSLPDHLIEVLGVVFTHPLRRE